MSCTEKLQKWHKKGNSATKRAATQIKLNTSEIYVEQEEISRK